jgi:hypothetical protein
MKTRTVFPTLVLFVIAYSVSSCFIPAAHSEEYMQPPVSLTAKDALPKGLLQGKNYKVDDKVKNDGFMNQYQLTTDYGPTKAESTAKMLIRINELNALIIMEEMDRKKVFGDALVEGVKAPVKGAAELVSSPVETSKNIVKGTGQFLSNVGNSIFSDDPDQDNVVKVALGYDVAKRQFAFEFGIDPYTNYEPVVNRLGEIARAAVAGGLTPKAAMAAVDNDVVLAMRISGTAYGMMQLVRDTPPHKLEEINRAKLEKMGIQKPLVDAFIDNHGYNPQEETLVVGALESMKGVEGLDVFLSQASLANSETTALYHRIHAEMIAGYHSNVAPFARILNTGGVLTVQTKDGALTLLAPVDYVIWTKKLDDEVKSLDSSIQKMGTASSKELWVTGKLEKTARANFESNGWKVKENANDVLIKK